MREISFIGQRVDNGEWVEGFLFKTEEHTYIAYDEQYDDDLFLATKNIFIEVIPETVGQFTGLTDKYNKKIFEGDILEFSDRFVTVFWHAHLGCWDSHFLKFTNKENGRDDMSPLNWSYKSKVIGNITDNPELLKGGAEE